MREKLEIKKVLRWLPGVLVSILIFFLITRIVNINVFVDSILEFGYKDMLVIIGITLISIAARAVVWMKFLPEVKFIDLFLLVNESYLFNNIIPRSGEIIKTILFAQPASVSTFEVLSYVIVERSLDLIIAASMFLATFPFISQLNTLRPIALTLLILLLSFLFTGLLISLRAEKVKSWLRNITKGNKNFKEKILPKIELFIGGFKILTNWKQFVSVIFWIIISWLSWTYIIFYGTSAIQQGVKLWWAIFTQGVLALGIALPSAPAGLGVFEGTIVVALSVFDISAEKALGIAVVIHLLQIFVTTIFGLIAVMRQGDSIADILKKMQSERLKKYREK